VILERFSAPHLERIECAAEFSSRRTRPFELVDLPIGSSSLALALR
jgi:hypothetical protein